MINVIIVGAGGIGERHLRCFQRAGVDQVGLVESNPERRDLIATRYGCPAFATWKDARKAGPWTVGVIATPAQTHIPIALELLAEGLDLLIEKPLAVSLDGIPELLQYDQTRIIRVAYVYRHMPLLAELKTRLENSDLGVLLSAQVVCGEDFSLARPDYARIYYARHESGGGAIQDLLTHFTNAMDWLLGPSEMVQCISGNRKLRDVSVEDTVCCSVRHVGGILVSYYLSQGQVAAETAITVHCERGSVRADLTGSRFGEYLPGAGDWTWTPFGPFERDDFYARQVEAFLDALKGGNGPSCTLPEAIHSLQGSLAALASARLGSVLEVKA